MDVWRMVVDNWDLIDFKMQYFGREHMYASIVIIASILAAIGYGMWTMYKISQADKQKAPDDVGNNAFRYAFIVMWVIILAAGSILFTQGVNIYYTSDHSKHDRASLIKSQGKKVQINDTLGVDRVVAAFEQEEMKSNPDAYKTASVGLQASDDNSDAYLWKFVGGEEATFLVNQKGYIYAATFQLPNGAYEKHKKELLLFLRKLIVVDVAPDVLEKAVNEVVKGKTTAFFSRNAWRDYVLSYDGQRFVIEAYEAE